MAEAHEAAPGSGEKEAHLRWKIKQVRLVSDDELQLCLDALKFNQ